MSSYGVIRGAQWVKGNVFITSFSHFQNDNYDLVQALIVFGADVNWVNNMGHSVRHEAATRIGKNK